MKVTFGVAVYNVSQYLEACVESILCQDGGDFEILIIDDGSTDQSGTICDRYAQKDMRIRVIHQENRGISAVRNRIIAEAEGEWISFIDGDDKIVEDAYRRMEKNLSDSFEMVYFDWQTFVYDHAVSAYTNGSPSVILENNAIVQLAFATLYKGNGVPAFANKTLRSVCAKAYRRSFLIESHLRLAEDLAYGEDILFNLQCLSKCGRVKLIQEPFYLYRQNLNSAVHKYNPGIIKQYTNLSQKLSAYLKTNPFGQDMEKRLNLESITYIMYVLKLDICHKENPKSKADRKKAFDQLMQSRWCINAIENADVTLLAKKDRRAYAVIKKKNFNAVNRFYQRKYWWDRMKRFANKTGISKRLKPLYDQLKRGI